MKMERVAQMVDEKLFNEKKRYALSHSITKELKIGNKNRYS